jgi:hypothetical protein
MTQPRDRCSRWTARTLIRGTHLVCLQLLVALFDGSSRFRPQTLQQFQQFGRIISLKMIIRAWADSDKRCTNVYHWHGRSDVVDCSHEFRTRHLVCVGIDDNSVRKSLEDLDRLMSAVRGKQIEFCSFNHQLAG